MLDLPNIYPNRFYLQRHIEAELKLRDYPYILKQTENESVIEIQTEAIPFKIHINNLAAITISITWAGPVLKPEASFQFINDFLGILRMQCPSFCQFKRFETIPGARLQK